MPAKVAARRRARSRTRRRPFPRRFHRPPNAKVSGAAAALLRAGWRSFPSQASLHRALVEVLKESDPTTALGARRMRLLLLAMPGIRWKVLYAERPTRRPLTSCPVCGGPVRPIRNRTLYEDRVTLGYRCTRCDYWTHLRRRVPVRYSFEFAERLGRERSPAPEAPATAPTRRSA